MASSWDTTVPIDHSLNSTWPSYIRNLKDLLKSRVLLSDSEPAVRPGGAAFAANDNGSIWIDSNSTIDNAMYILTDYSKPTILAGGWTLVSTNIIATLLAATREFSAADVTLTLKNSDSEDTDGGRQSKFVVKGLQSGDESSTLGYIEFSHEGTGDDQKGQFILMLNDGDDDDAPSKQPIGFSSDGMIDVANSLSVIDDDAMGATATDVVVSTAESIKAYIDDQISANRLGSWVVVDTVSSALVLDTVYLAQSDGIIVAYSVDNPSGVQENIQIYTDSIDASTLRVKSEVPNYDTPVASATCPVASGDYVKVTGTALGDISWIPFGTGGLVAQA